MIETTDDIDLIKRILCDEEIFPRLCGDDGPTPEEFEPELHDHIYLIGIDPEPYACMIYHPNNQYSVWCHVHVLPEYRQRAMQFGREALEWAFENIPYCYKICAQIPVCYPDVIRFAHKHGFVTEGTNSKSYMKDGQLIDQYYLGLSRWDS